jgi:protein-S-isoprenylcysteine O-methyltransferase Ste14
MILVTVLFSYLFYFALKYFSLYDCIVLMLFFVLYLGSSIIDTFAVAEPESYVIEDADGRSYLYMQLASMVVLLYGILDFLSFKITRISFGPEYMTTAGIIIFLLTIILRVSALRTLRIYFNLRVALYERHVLVTDGLYTHIRHPLYAASLLTNLAFVLIFNSWGALLLVVLLVSPAVWYRVKIEEKFLLKHFKLDYEEYAKRSKYFIPGIW